MTLDSQEMCFTLTAKDVSVWMAALRMAANHSSVPIIPWDSCPFLGQHKELVRLTGYGARDHEDLYQALKTKWGKQ
jgi:hypothetical protein